MASLILRNNGVYYAVVTSGRKRQWNSLFTRDRSEALAIYERSYANAPWGTSKRISGIGKSVCEFVKNNFSIETWKIYVRTLKTFERCIGNIPVRNLKVVHFEQFKKQRLNSKVKPVTINIDLRTLRAAFTKAYELELIDTNPARHIKLFRIPQGEPEFLTEGEFNSLLSPCKDVMFRELLITAVLTGMRRSELANLHWEDINFDRGIIRIRNRENFTVKGQKPRTIPLHTALRKTFLRRSELSGPVFLDSNRQPYRPSRITRLFKSLARGADLPENIHFHSLRHTTASWLVQKGVSIYTVNALLGHRSISTTQIYAHLENDNMQKSIQVIEAPQSLQLAA